MTKQDFDLILIESFVHDTKQSYFEQKREEFKCNVDEYCNGLNESFRKLNDEVNRLDYYHVILTTPEGEEQFFEMDKDQSLSEQTNYLRTIGKVTYPNKRTIDIKEATNGEVSVLTAQMMSGFWVDLEKYLQSVTLDEPQQNEMMPFQIENEELRFQDILTHPEKHKLFFAIKEMIKPRSGKNNGLLIRALEELEYIDPLESSNKAKLYRSMRVEFGEIGKDSGLNLYYTKNDEFRIEIDLIKTKIQAKL